MADRGRNKRNNVDAQVKALRFRRRIADHDALSSLSPWRLALRYRMDCKRESVEERNVNPEDWSWRLFLNRKRGQEL
jgi:hypothetical protein